MNRFVSLFRKIVSQKITVSLFIIAMMVVVAGGSQLRPSSSAFAATSAYAATSSYAANSAYGATTIPQNASVASMINQVFGPYSGSAMRVAQCESSLNPNATNPQPVGNSHAEGVFQILYPSTWSTTPYAGSSPYSAWANINAAHSIFVRDGYSWREWQCQP